MNAKTCAMVCLACLLPGRQAADGADRVVAPNTVRKAMSVASTAIVKLHGRGLGREHGYGTGCLVSADGQIVTALSLMAASGRVRAVLHDGTTYPTKLIRTDDYRQLALLKIDAENLPHLRLASTETARMGDTVIAIGNWYKVAEGRELVSVHRGILGMRTDLHATRYKQDYTYRGPVLIFDAITSNPGAPGGALLDLDGNCLGIIGRNVHAVSTNTRLNYAIPSEEVMAFLGGKPSPLATSAPAEDAPQVRPYVGIKISKLGFRHVSAYVERVRRGSPASSAGIKPDDLIIEIDGRRIPDATAYKAAIKKLVPGQDSRFLIKRGRSLLQLTLTVGEKKK